VIRLMGCGPEYEKEQLERSQVLRVKRFCTDCEWLLFFVVYCVFMITAFAYACNKGHYYHMTHGMDFRGEACGTGRLHGYPHQAWVNPLIETTETTSICVSHCPDPINGAEIDQSTVRCICNPKHWPNEFGRTTDQNDASATLISKCKQPLHARLGYFTIKVGDAGDQMALTTYETETSHGVDRPCAFVYKSALAMRKCAPQVHNDSLSAVVTQTTEPIQDHDYVADQLKTGKAIMNTVMTDAVWSLPILLVCILIAVFMALVAMVLLIHYTESFAKISIVASGLILAVWDGVNWWRYQHFKDLAESSPPLATNHENNISKDVYLVLFIIGCVLTVLYSLIGYFVYGKLSKVEKHEHAKEDDDEKIMIPSQTVSIMRASAKAFYVAPSLMIYPILHTLSFTIVLIAWIYGALLLRGAGNIDVGADGVALWDYSDWLGASSFAYVFGLVWVAGFLNAVGYMIVSGTVLLSAFATPKPWKFKRHDGSCEREIPHSPLVASFCLISRYHLGTAALGSLILLFIGPVRTVTDFISKIFFFTTHEEDNQENAKSHMKCNECLIRLNRMAFLMTMLHSYSFCPAGVHGLISVAENMKVIEEALYVSSFVLEANKVAISLAGAAISEGLLHSGWFGVTDEELTYSWVMVVVVSFSLYIIVTSFMVSLEVTIEAYLAGFCESTDRIAVDLDPEQKDGIIKGDGGVTTEQLPHELKEHVEAYGWTLKNYEADEETPHEETPLITTAN